MRSTRAGPRSLTLAARLSTLDSPATFAERLPKALIHHNVPGEPVHDLLRALDDGVAARRPVRRFGAAAALAATRWPRSRPAGWPVLDRPARWRLGEVTVAWPRPLRSFAESADPPRIAPRLVGTCDNNRMIPDRAGRLLRPV